MDKLVIPEIKPIAGPTPNSRFLDTLNILLPQAPRNAHYPQDPIEFINRVLGLDTWEGQDRIVRAVWENRYTSVASCHGIGKGVHVNEHIATLDGWTTMAEIRVGDRVFDESGNPCTVTAVSPVREIPCYRVTFNDGATIVVDKDHLWSVLRFRWRGTTREVLRTSGDPVDTDWRRAWANAEVVDTPTLKTIIKTPWGQRDASIPLNKALNLPEVDLPIDPYILGAWLGDGTTGEPAITSADTFIVQEIERRGWSCKLTPSTAHKSAPRYAFKPKDGSKARWALRSLGVLGNKHIPTAYLRSSERQRRALLAGLLDTDGFLSQRSGAGIDLCHERLANDVAELIRSLGYRVNVRDGFVRCNGKRIRRWRLSFTPQQNPFLLPRKADSWIRADSQLSRLTHRFVESVEEADSVPTRCIAVDSPNKLFLVGKAMIPTHNSTISAALVLTFLHLKENSIVLTTAPTGRQVEHILWRNIRSMHRKARIPLLGGKPLTLRYDIAEEWYGMGFKPADAETDPTQGFHAENMLVVIDEAAGAPIPIIDGLHAAMTTEGSRFLMIGNPTSISGPFYDSHHSRNHLYETINISWEDTPNFLAGKTVIKGLITEMWVKEMIDKYGEDSAFVKSRVYAEWVPVEGVLIPMSQIEAARERTWEDIVGIDDFRQEAGLDVARSGDDKSVLTIRKGPLVIGQWPIPGKEGWETAGATLSALKDHDPDLEAIKIDVVGIGAAVVDVMKRIVEDQKALMRVVPVNFSKKPHDQESYGNQRDEAYGTLVQRFRTGMIAGAIHDMTVADLSDLRGKFDARYTQRRIEPKEAYKDRVGRSPDFADSLSLAFYNPPREEKLEIGALAFGKARQKWGEI